MAMRTGLAFLLAACATGCAMRPLTPEQYEYLRQVQIYTPVPNPYAAQATSPTPQPFATFQPASQRAVFTGKQTMVQTVTNQVGWQCQYNLHGRLFDRVFIGSCPALIDVQ